MPILIKRAGAKPTLLATKPPPIAPAPRPASPAVKAPALPSAPAASAGLVTSLPIETGVSPAMAARWGKIPAPNAKPKLCTHCGQHYLRPCTEVEKVGCGNYAYAKQFGQRPKEHH